jgi:hypothetical protein
MLVAIRRWRAAARDGVLTKSLEFVPAGAEAASPSVGGMVAAGRVMGWTVDRFQGQRLAAKAVESSAGVAVDAVDVLDAHSMQSMPSGSKGR